MCVNLGGEAQCQCRSARIVFSAFAHRNDDPFGSLAPRLEDEPALPEVCSGRGQCQSDGSCACPAGTFGPECQWNVDNSRYDAVSSACRGRLPGEFCSSTLRSACLELTYQGQFQLRCFRADSVRSTSCELGVDHVFKACGIAGRCAVYRPANADSFLFACRSKSSIPYLGDDAAYTTAATTTTITTTAPLATPKPTPKPSTCENEPCAGRKEGDACQVYTGEGTLIPGRCSLDAKKRLVCSLKESTLADICEAPLLD